MKTINVTNINVYVDYRRKSSEAKERQALSVKEQREVNTDLAKREKLNVRYAFEESRSAFKPNNRPKFDEMLALIESGKCNAILTWKPDRLCRNPREGGILLQLLQDGVLKEIRCSSGETFTQDSDHLVLNIHFGMANEYSRNLSKNVKRGNSYKFHTKKQWIGPAKLGYLNYQDKDSEEKRIKVDKDRFDLIQRAIKLILSGTYTPMEALHVLNNEWGFRTKKTKKQGGRPIAKSGWYKLLSDPYYYGLMVRSEGEEMGNHTKMITQDEFDKLQIILGRKGKPRITKHEFAYKEVLKCGECGGSITAEEKWQIMCPKCKTKFHKGKTTNECSGCHLAIEEMKNPKILHYVYYHCTKRVNTKCTQGHITLKNLEKKIVEELAKFEIPEAYRDWAIKYLKELNDDEETDQSTIKDNLISQFNKNDKAIRNLLREKISPENAGYDSEMQEYYESEKKRLFKEKETIKKALQKFDERQKQWFEQSKDAFDFACTAKYTFAQNDAKSKTYVLSRLGSNLTIKDKTLHVSGENAYFLIEKGKKQIESIVEALEPTKRAEIAGNLLSFEHVRTTWLSSWDLVGTFISSKSQLL